MAKQKQKNKNNEENENIATLDSLQRRLDILIRILLRKEFQDDGGKPSQKDIVQYLKKSGWSPTEIAKLLGLKSRTSISTYLYKK